MNKVILIGRLTRDVEVRKTSSNLSVADFSLAIPRRLSKEAKEQGQQETDFINCIAWRGSADYLGNYGKKGTRTVVEGKLQTRNYEGKDGKKVYVTEVLCDSVQLIADKRDDSQQVNAQPKYEQKEMLPYGRPSHDIVIDTDDLPFY